MSLALPRLVSGSRRKVLKRALIDLALLAAMGLAGHALLAGGNASVALAPLSACSSLDLVLKQADSDFKNVTKEPIDLGSGDWVAHKTTLSFVGANSASVLTPDHAYPDVHETPEAVFAFAQLPALEPCLANMPGHWHEQNDYWHGNGFQSDNYDIAVDNNGFVVIRRR